jgi:hypothetical protein
VLCVSVLRVSVIVFVTDSFLGLTGVHELGSAVNEVSAGGEQSFGRFVQVEERDRV